MHGLEVRRHKVRVPPRHLKRAVAQDLLEMEHAAAAPQIEHRKRMTETVERSCGRCEAEMLAK